MNELAKRRELRPVATTQEALQQLVESREKLSHRLDALKSTLHAMPNWKAVVERRPWLAVGGVFLMGYALGRLVYRK